MSSNREAIFISSPLGEMQIGPFIPDDNLTGDWVRRLHGAKTVTTTLFDATITLGAYDASWPTVNPEEVPVTPRRVAETIDAWARDGRPGHALIDLYTLVVCKLGRDEADRVWGEAESLYDIYAAHHSAGEAERPEFWGDAERDRIAALINDELDAGEGVQFDTVGHVAYDAVIGELWRRHDTGDMPGPAKAVMSALIEMFGVMSILNSLADRPHHAVPFSDNIRRAATMIEESRALLTEMIMFGSAHLDNALARAGMVAVTLDELEEGGAPAELLTKIRQRLEAAL